MAKFRCPRCGAVVEGLHDRCPRCKVLFKYRKEDVELLTPYKAPEVSTPERLEPLPPVKEEKLPEPIQEAEVKPEEAPVEEVKVEEPAPEPVKEEPKLDKKACKKAGTASLVFGLLSFFLTWLLGGILSIIFGSVAISKAKKAKPVGGGKRVAGKTFGILGLIFGIFELLWTLFLLFILGLVLLALIAYVIINLAAPDVLTNAGLPLIIAVEAALLL